MTHELPDASLRPQDTRREEKKLSIEASYDELEQAIPEVASMKGFDQRSDFHSLTLDEHTKELVRNIEEDEYLKTLDARTRSLVILAGKLHDLGKVDPEGQQVHPKDPEKRQYAGHEKVSRKIVEKILPQYFDLTPEEQGFVAGLVGLHASALELINNFQGFTEVKGKQLGYYDEFLAKVEAIPGPLSLEAKMRLIFTINRADKKAGYNANSDITNPKVKSIIERSVKQLNTLDQLQRALPAFIEAVRARRAGDQYAGVFLDNGEYVYRRPEMAQKRKDIPQELRPLGGLLRDKTVEVSGIWTELQSAKAAGIGLDELVEQELRQRIGLTPEQIEKVLGVL